MGGAVDANAVDANTIVREAVSGLNASRATVVAANDLAKAAKQRGIGTAWKNTNGRRPGAKTVAVSDSHDRLAFF